MRSIVIGPFVAPEKKKSGETHSCALAEKDGAVETGIIKAGDVKPGAVKAGASATRAGKSGCVLVTVPQPLQTPRRRHSPRRPLCRALGRPLVEARMGPPRETPVSRMRPGRNQRCPAPQEHPRRGSCYRSAPCWMAWCDGAGDDDSPPGWRELRRRFEPLSAVATGERPSDGRPRRERSSAWPGGW